MLANPLRSQCEGWALWKQGMENRANAYSGLFGAVTSASEFRAKIDPRDAAAGRERTLRIGTRVHQDSLRPASCSRCNGQLADRISFFDVRRSACGVASTICRRLVLRPAQKIARHACGGLSHLATSTRRLGRKWRRTCLLPSRAGHAARGQRD